MGMIECSFDQYTTPAQQNGTGYLIKTSSDQKYGLVLTVAHVIVGMAKVKEGYYPVASMVKFFYQRNFSTPGVETHHNGKEYKVVDHKIYSKFVVCNSTGLI